MVDMDQYARQAAAAVTKFRSGTNPHWNDSYLNMGAQLATSAMANAQQKELWDEMNRYNSPAEQMKRFKEAGLNPMLIYQQGSPGNASSPADYTSPNYELHPGRDMATQISMASEVIGMVSNLAQNINQIFQSGYDTQIKRNEAAWSNLEYAAGNRFIYGLGMGRNVTPGYRVTSATGPDGTEYTHFPNVLNPLSSDFSPLEYTVLSRLGKIPNYFNQWRTTDANVDLTGYRARYQQYYNDHLLPLFERYQSG